MQLIRVILLSALYLVTLPCQAASERFTVMVFGDSLSAAFGMAPEQGWVSLLGERLAERGIAVVNRSISGETTAGGLRRLPNALAEVDPDLVVIELGANDGLRGLDLGTMRTNLRKMVELSRDAGARVLLLGVRIPPNYGPQYTEDFAAAYRDVAGNEGVALLPFFLEPIADDWDFFQDDGIHPTVAAQPLILSHVMTVLEPLLADGAAAN